MWAVARHYALLVVIATAGSVWPGDELFDEQLTLTIEWTDPATTVAGPLRVFDFNLSSDIQSLHELARGFVSHAPFPLRGADCDPSAMDENKCIALALTAHAENMLMLARHATCDKTARQGASGAPPPDMDAAEARDVLNLTPVH